MGTLANSVDPDGMQQNTKFGSREQNIKPSNDENMKYLYNLETWILQKQKEPTKLENGRLGFIKSVHEK